MTVLANLLALLSLDDDAYLEGLTNAQKHTNTFTQNLASVGGTVVAGAFAAAGAAIATVGGFLASSIEPASDLNETMSKVTVVFGDSADAILAWGDTAATTMGMSKNSALAAAGTYGNLFRAMGMSEDVSAKMSTSLVQLAGDLASFNNMDPTEVLDKLRAGLSGETEPLKSLGVNINETLLKQKAMEMGLWDGVGALDAASKAQASYALIMEQTTLAQGDFARTSGGLANQQRILAAKFEDIRAKVGTALLPVLTKLATTLSDYLSRPEFIAFIDRFAEGVGNLAQRVLDALPGIISWFQNAITFLQNNEGIVIGIFAALGVAVMAWAVTTAATAWMAVAPFLPVIAVLALVGAAVYLLYQAWTNNWGGIQEKTAAVAAWIREAVNSVMTWLSDFVNGRLGVVSQLFHGAWTNIQLIFQAFKAAFQGDWYQFGVILRQIWENTLNTLKSVFTTAWEGVKNSVRNGIAAMKSFFTDTDWGAVGRAIIEGIANGIMAGIRFIQNAARTAAQAALDAAKGFLGIESPSKLFEVEVGFQMAAGVARGWEDGIDGMIPSTMGALTPSVAPANASIAGGVGGGMVVNINVTSDGITDEKDIARKIASAVEVILRERGLA